MRPKPVIFSNFAELQILSSEPDGAGDDVRLAMQAVKLNRLPDRG